MLSTHVSLLDYLTTTTFLSASNIFYMREALQQENERNNYDHSTSRQQGYNGVMTKGEGSVFFGTKQLDDERDHYMLRCSGGAAERAFYVLPDNKDTGIRCTRIDLQITIPIEADWDYSARRLRDSLESAKFRRRGSRPGLTLLENADGLDTIYIGSRASGRLIRIYVKPTDYESCLRLEVEFKGDLAQAAYHALKCGKKVSEILASELNAWSGVNSLSWQRLVVAVGDDIHNLSVVGAIDDFKTNHGFLINTVDAYIRRLLAEDDMRAEVKSFLDAWQSHFRHLEQN